MKFTVNKEEYVLDEDKFGAFRNDEEKPVQNIDEEDILKILENRELDFEKAYYSIPCENCNSEKSGEKKIYKFFEYHLYLYTKDCEVVTNSLDIKDEETSFKRLLNQKEVDNSYIVTIMVCCDCGDFEIEIDEFEI
ncbi:DUF3785 family protein [Clostridium vincentii]|uniref:DUF3785 domain-containing protein n=1 Tax=Clostridium vincentii TaxID=52704 RepID=A0A2T0BCA4_9CLOT|nr:DUF3785 family protein [Clostridium vincentii]PRR81463.1 hypothetical protein CLVI_24900 [Clostridium vincentii]